LLCGADEVKTAKPSGKKFRIIFRHTDPYTWELKREDITVGIGSASAAETWAKQTFYRVFVHRVEEV
jgi:hypothetical protein